MLHKSCISVHGSAPALPGRPCLRGPRTLGTGPGNYAADSSQRPANRHASTRLRTATLDTPSGAGVRFHKEAPVFDKQHEQAKDTYSWTKQWWPVFPVFQLDKLKPHPVTMLGKDYVVWWDEPASQWSVLEDRCPHRLAALSAGRIVDGKLACSYHGWQFNGKGACAVIPQIGDARALDVALHSSRTCVTSFPTRVDDGVLFAWLDSSPNAAAEAKAAEKSMVTEFVAGDAAFSPEWFCSTTANDYSLWLENAMDPGHVPFVHHGVGGFNMASAVAFEADASPVPPGIDLQQGFVWQHGGFDTRTANIKGHCEFRAPHTVINGNETPPKPGDPQAQSRYEYFQSMTVPVMPGVCRLFVKAGGGKQFAAIPKKKPGLFGKPSIFSKYGLISRLSFGLQHMLRARGRVVDQDVVVLNGQEANMRKNGMSGRNYNLFARGDAGVKALHKWLRQAKYDNMWDERRPDAAAAWKPASIDQQLDYWSRHTSNCAVCQKEYGNLTHYCSVLRHAGTALGVIALVLIAAGHGTNLWANLGAVLCGAACGACFWAKEKLVDMRDTYLVSNSKHWREVGGMSLVKGVPIQL